MPNLGVYGKKLGPMPIWAWALIGLGIALGIAQFRAGQKKKASPDQEPAADEVPADQVPSTIFQNYTTVNIPEGEAGPPGPAGPAGPAGPKGPAAPPVQPPKKPAPAPKPKPGKTNPKPLEYRVKRGDTLSAIAKRYHTTWQKLWAYNTKAGNRPAKTIETLKKRGPNLLYAGELILIPRE